MEELNVQLREKMNLFFAALVKSREDGTISEEERKDLQMKEAQMLSEVLKGTYLVPAKMTPNGTAEFGILTTNEPKAEWFAAFTNIEELQKLFDPNQWTVLSLSYDDVIREAGSRCAVIDPAGYNVRITEQNKGMIESFRENLVEQEAPEVTEEPETIEEPKVTEIPEATEEPQVAENVTKDTSGVLENAAAIEETQIGFFAPIDESAHFTPANCPQPILTALSSAMGQMPDVRRAYMVCMQSSTGACFLAVIDTLGDQNAIMEALYQSAVPYLNGMELKMHGSDMWGLTAVKGIKPFYKKSFFK